MRHVPILLCALASAACVEEPSVCSADWDCATGLICIDGRCSSAPDASRGDAGPGRSQCIDTDGDGYGVGESCLGVDCNDLSTEVFEGAPETCDGRDEDCDGLTDEELGTTTCGVGGCEVTVDACAGGEAVECVPGEPAAETCNGVDDDCDATTDEGALDELDGDELAPHWTVGAVGGAPTFTVEGGFLRVADAPFATTPSSPFSSWIYEVDTDLGNQIAWPQAVGTGDFDLHVDLDWASDGAEVTLAGVGLTNASGQLELMIGYSDGSSAASGAPAARIRVPGADATWGGTVAAIGAASYRVERAGGVARVTRDGELVLESPMDGDVANLVVYAVRHRAGRVVYTFGSFGLDRVQLCY